MRVAYIDMIGGASGNMLLGAFVDAGLDLDATVTMLQTLSVDGWTIEGKRVERHGIAATYIDVVVPGEDDHVDHAEAHRHPPGRRTLSDVQQIFQRSKLSIAQKVLALRIATRLFEAEGLPNFHPIGQIDAILDIAATCIASEELRIEKFFCSAFPVGYRLPKPTQRLLGSVPARLASINAEMVTMTGAAILTTLVQRPGERPPIVVECEGYGAGRSDFPIPNVTRVEIGEI